MNAIELVVFAGLVAGNGFFDPGSAKPPRRSGRDSGSKWKMFWLALCIIGAIIFFLTFAWLPLMFGRSTPPGFPRKLRR